VPHVSLYPPFAHLPAFFLSSHLPSYLCFFFLMIPPPPRPTLFPYTTLFRSAPRRLLALRKDRERGGPARLRAIVGGPPAPGRPRSEEHTSELQSLTNLVCRLLLEKKKKQ